MAQLNKFELLLPEDLKTELTKIAEEKSVGVDSVILEAVKVYVSKEKKKSNKEKLKKGYLEMAQFNSAYAEMCLDADNECLKACEEKLSECE